MRVKLHFKTTEDFVGHMLQNCILGLWCGGSLEEWKPSRGGNLKKKTRKRARKQENKKEN